MATTKAGAKRLLFKKPAWASTTTKTTNEDQPIFGQAHLYQEILQSEKERRQRHAARQKEREAKDNHKEQEREFKRRRISNEAEDSEYGSDSDAKSTKDASPSSDQDQRSITPVQQEPQKPTTTTPTKRRNKPVNQLNTARSPHTRSQKAQAAANQESIVLDGDDSPTQSQEEYNASEPEILSVQPSSKLQTQPESDSEEEDEYLRELKLKARQEARSKKSGLRAEDGTLGSLTPQPFNDAQSPTMIDPASPPAYLEVRDSRATSTPMVDEEAEVKILIKSLIPGVKELIVNRKIGQPLDKVKEFWTKRNGLDPAIADKVFFTWNGTRLYNSSTMRGIIERLKKSHPMKDGSDPSEGRIMIEAVTDEIFEYRQKQRARRLAEAEAEAEAKQHNTSSNNHDSGINDEATGEDGTPIPQAQKSGIVIRLKAQGLDDMQLRVRPNTTMQKILNGFRRMKEVPTDKQSWLSYDGDRLEDDATVEEVGFEHEDTVDVYLR